MSNLVAWIGGAAGSFWSVELEAEGVTHVRGPQPHEQSWPSSALRGCSSPGFSLMAFFWSERPSWPLLPCTCRRIKRWSWEKGHSSFPHPTLLRQFQECPGAALSRCLAAHWPCRWSLLWLTLLEGDETLETLSVAVAGSSEPSACLWRWTWGKKCAVSAC